MESDSSSMDSSEFNDSDYLPSSTRRRRTTNAQGHKKPHPTAQSSEMYAVRVLNTKLSYEFMPGSRSNSNLLFCHEEQQFYKRKNYSKHGDSYVYREKWCKCRVYVVNNECYIKNNMPHKHGSKIHKYYNWSALNEMKRIVRSADNKLTTKTVFDDVIKR